MVNVVHEKEPVLDGLVSVPQVLPHTLPPHVYDRGKEADHGPIGTETVGAHFNVL